MLQPRRPREDMKGHILKRVSTRIDYQDTFGLDPATLKILAKICKSFGLHEMFSGTLEPSDFETNDPVSITSIPYEYLRDANSHVFHTPDMLYFFEVNQFFVEITQHVPQEREGYVPFSRMVNLVDQVLKVLVDFEEIQVKRLSIRKVNQVFYDEYSKIQTFFKPEVIQFGQFNHSVDWGIPYSQSHSVQNFEIEGRKVNFTRIYDSGRIKNQQLFRLFLQFEVYRTDFSQGQDHVQMIDEMNTLNDILYRVFEHTLTDKSVELLCNNERIGDIDETQI
jgi:uncharacterized protein (TIGR04255 family)